MKPSTLLGIAVTSCFIVLPFSGRAQPAPASATPTDSGVPIAQLIASVAKSARKKFVVDPRVKADVIIVGQEPADMTYSDLLTILNVHGFAAVEGGNYVRIVPDPGVRSLAIPQISGNETRADAEYVSKIVPVRNLPAASLVPILRPLLPQQGHLAASVCSNSMIVVDTFANVRRIEALIRSLDVGEPYQAESCEMREAVNSAPRQ